MSFLGMLAMGGESNVDSNAGETVEVAQWRTAGEWVTPPGLTLLTEMLVESHGNARADMMIPAVGRENVWVAPAPAHDGVIWVVMTTDCNHNGVYCGTWGLPHSLKDFNTGHMPNNRYPLVLRVYSPEQRAKLVWSERAKAGAARALH